VYKDVRILGYFSKPKGVRKEKNSLGNSAAEDIRARVTKIQINNTDYRTRRRSACYNIDFRSVIAVFIHFVIVFAVISVGGF
jgi:hypothetical protein